MDKDEIAIILIIVVINAMIILCFCLRHRRAVRKMNRFIFRQIQEQEDLKRKLERACIEKEVLVNCLKIIIGEKTTHN
jgi:signal transduction histidine kinase